MVGITVDDSTMTVIIVTGAPATLAHDPLNTGRAPFPHQPW
jgi:hypothetical protein